MKVHKIEGRMFVRAPVEYKTHLALGVLVRKVCIYAKHYRTASALMNILTRKFFKEEQDA